MGGAGRFRCSGVVLGGGTESGTGQGQCRMEVGAQLRPERCPSVRKGFPGENPTILREGQTSLWQKPRPRMLAGRWNRKDSLGAPWKVD